MIPESQKHYNDVIDLLTEACQDVVETEQADGSRQKSLVINPKKAWWKTNIINSPYAGRFAFELEELERLASLCRRFMSKERAEDMEKQIMDLCASFRYSIDAKSSESQRDKNNAQSTLIDKLIRNKQEKIYSVKGEGKKAFLESILGRDSEREKEE